MGSPRHHVVIVGGGFAGLFLARKLGSEPVDVTLLDRRNVHVFQPLLYQVATGGLSPGDISSPLRAVLARHANVRVEMAEVMDFDVAGRQVILRDERMSYDTLAVAAGVRNSWFGNDAWERHAPGLKTIEDALEIRRRVLLAFEAAEREPDPARHQAWQTFVVVGGGATGVELAGALGELSHSTLRRDFRNLDLKNTRILLLEGGSRILPAFPKSLAQRAALRLERLGVTVQTQTMVTEISAQHVTVKGASEEDPRRVPARTVLWAAGVAPSPLGRRLAEATGAAVDGAGRVNVSEHLTVPGHDEIYVLGDLARVPDEEGHALPGVAPVAMQQGAYAGHRILRRLRDKPTEPFRYRDKGSMAVVGRNAAIAKIGRLKVWGFPAWLLWVFVHIAYLIEFDNRLLVMLQWGSNYITRKRGARLITGEESHRQARRNS